MLAFPVLRTGCLAQQGVRRQRSWRMRRNELPNGSTVHAEDSAERWTRWELPLTDLTQVECDELLDLFSSTRGRLDSFVFADPLANTLAWSEDLLQPTWQKDALLEIEKTGTSDGVAVHRLSHTAGTMQGVKQGLMLPGSFPVCWHAAARGSGSFQLRVTRGSEARSVGVELSGQWQRLVVNGPLAAGLSTTTFEVLTGTGAVAEISELQVDVQANPSAYRPSSDQNGVYPTTRFDQDELRWTALGPDRYAMKVRLGARES